MAARTFPMDFDDKLSDEQEEVRRLRQKYEYHQNLADRYLKAIEALSGPGRFAGWFIKDAAHAIIKENGRPVPESDLVNIIKEGGATTGKRDPIKQIRDSLEKRIGAKKLKRVGDLIGLPDMEFPNESDISS